MKSFLLLIFTSLTIAVFGNLNADFTADKYAGCPPLLVNFTNASAPSTATLSWDFGNGNTSTLQNPSAVFNTTGVYQVRLIASNGGQSDTMVRTITIYALPQVDFTVQETNICGNDTIFFTSNVTLGSAPITDYAWGFGNGVASSDKDAKYVYNQLGQYDITLVVQDSNSCSSSLTKPGFITVKEKPVAAFTANPQMSCNATETVQFTNSSTGNGLSFDWSLSDSVTSTLANPSHTYTNEVYTVRLTVTNNIGCKATTTRTVRIADVNAEFSANKPNACTGETIRFSNESNFVRSTFWDFGDGTSRTVAGGGRTTNKIYTTPGTYTVKMINNYFQCSDSIVKVAYITIREGVDVSFETDQPTSGGCSNSATINFTNTTSGGVSFFWRFGDGTTSTAENPTHTYPRNNTYTVTLTVVDTSGCTVSGTMPTTVNTNIPVPSFRADTLSCPGSPVRFNNRTVGATSYFWDFGDGDTSTMSGPTHFYQTTGTYTVSLKAFNADGCDSTVTRTIRIENVETDFSVDRTFSPCPPFVTLFTSTGNSANLKYLWDFGDGTTDTAANPTHIYFHPGIYTVKLIARLTAACTDTVVYPDLIEVQGPTGTFSAVPTSGCAPLDVTFATTVSANTRQMWCDLGDGNIITDSLNFMHTYTGIGTYNPKFILVDHVGCTVPFDLPPIVTHESPSLQLSDTAICEGASVQVTLGADSYSWSPAQFLSCANCNNPGITPAETITYSVTASNQHGCQTIDTMRVSVDAIPVMTAPATVKICKGATVELFAGNAASYSWSPASSLSDSTEARPEAKPEVSTVYTVTGFNGLGCSATAQAVVNVIDKIDIEASSDIIVCRYDSFQINTTLLDGPDAEVTYFWSPDGYVTPLGNPNPVIRNVEGDMIFHVIAQSDYCTPDTASIQVKVVELPEMEVSEDVTTAPMAEVALSAASRQSLTYSWIVPNGDISCSDCRRTNIYPKETQYVYVTGTDKNGCKVIDSVLINVLQCDPKAVFAANTFTPNGDGLNDRFVLRSKVLDRLSYFRIFDQWGNMVFETKDINEGWDGTINGNPAPVAVYAYLMSGECNNGYDVTKSDNITLVR